MFNPWLIRTVLLLRHGSLTEFGLPIRTIYAVSKLVGCSWRQVKGICQRYVHGVVDRRRKEYRTTPHYMKRRAFPQSEAITQELLSESVLREWARFSLEDRAIRVTQQHGIPCSRTQLLLFYKRHGIRYKRCDHQYFEHATQGRPHMLKRRLFALTLQSLAIRNEPVIFQDESSINVWCRRNYFW